MPQGGISRQSGLLMLYFIPFRTDLQFDQTF